MQFEDIGRHCSVEDCGQQDFLPFRCEFCQDIFCAEHRRPDDHACKSEDADAIDDNYVIICPLCQDALSLKGLQHQGITPSQLWNEHVETGECQLKQIMKNSKNERLPGDRASHCQARDCNTKLTDYKYFKCPKCSKDVCIKHRFGDLH